MQNFPQNNIAYPLIRKRTCACQDEKNVSFSEIFVYVLHKQPPWEILRIESDVWYRYRSHVIFVYSTDQKYRKDEICNIIFNLL